MNERLAPEGGSGASVYVCTVDGWQCVVKALNLRGLAPALVHKFESEGLVFFFCFFFFVFFLFFFLFLFLFFYFFIYF